MISQRVPRPDQDMTRPITEIRRVKEIRRGQREGGRIW